ncbi:hypothetical protein Bca4012_068453 [Brassica carinata]
MHMRNRLSIQVFQENFIMESLSMELFISIADLPPPGGSAPPQLGEALHLLSTASSSLLFHCSVVLDSPANSGNCRCSRTACVFLLWLRLLWLVLQWKLNSGLPDQKIDGVKLNSFEDWSLEHVSLDKNGASISIDITVTRDHRYQSYLVNGVLGGWNPLSRVEVASGVSCQADTTNLTQLTCWLSSL